MPRALLVTSFGLGYLRPAPGTWGSLPPAALAGMMLCLGASPALTSGALGAVLAVACVICVVLGRWAEGRFGRKDASEIVIDETAGQCLPLMFWPAEFTARCRVLSPDAAPDWAALVRAALAVGSAFLLFRIMDIVKPPPAHGLQRLPHGWGVLVDDLIAGLYAATVMQIGLRLMM